MFPLKAITFENQLCKLVAFKLYSRHVSEFMLEFPVLHKLGGEVKGFNETQNISCGITSLD